MLVIVSGSHVCGHIISFSLLRGRARVQSFCQSRRPMATICSWLNLNSRQISGWNSQQLVWQDDITQAGPVSELWRVSEPVYISVAFLKDCFYAKVTVESMYFSETKRRIMLWKREAQGYGMKSGLSQAAQEGRIWDGLRRRSWPQRFSLFTSNSRSYKPPGSLWDGGIKNTDVWQS